MYENISVNDAEKLKLNEGQLDQLASEIHTFHDNLCLDYIKEYRNLIKYSDDKGEKLVKFIDKYFKTSDLKENIKIGLNMVEKINQIKKASFHSQETENFLDMLKIDVSRHETYIIVGVNSLKNKEK